MKTLFTVPVHINGESSVRVRPEGTVKGVTNLGWLVRKLGMRGVYAENIVVRERTEKEKILFPTYDCVFEVETNDSFKYSCMFADRNVLSGYLTRSRQLRGCVVNMFGTDYEIKSKLYPKETKE